MTDSIAAARKALGLIKKRRRYSGAGNEAHARQANAQIAAARSALEGRVHHVAAAIAAAEARVREECAAACDRVAAELERQQASNLARSTAAVLADTIRAGGGR